MSERGIFTHNPVEKITYPKTNEAIEYLAAQGAGLLSRDEVETLHTEYAKALIAGLNHQDAEGLAMTDSLIRHTSFESLNEGETALVFVIGGTNLRAALVTVGIGKAPKILRDPDTMNSRYTQINVPKTVFPEGPMAFYESMLGQLENFINTVDEKKVQGMGIIYSFAGTSIKNGQSLDMIPEEMMGKGFLVPGIDTIPVGEAMVNTRVLNRFSNVQRWAVMNDMPPVCVAAESKLGVILATGLNIAVAIDGNYYVTECGHFKDIPSHPYVNAVDLASNSIGYGLTEKQTSGRYIGEIFGYMVNDLRQKNLLEIALPDDQKWVSEEVGGLVSDPNYLRGAYTAETVDTLRNTAKMVTDRSAQIVGTMIGSSIAAFPNEFPEPTIKVPVEGALLWRIAGYKDIAQDYASYFSGGKNVEFVYIERSDVVGAGVVALSS